METVFLRRFVKLTNISINWLPNNLHEEAEGSHNGENYLAYTFYLHNMGTHTVNYWYTIYVDDVINRVDTAIRLMTEHIEMYYILAGIELVLVFALGLFVTKLPPAAALGIFFLYSAVNGLTIAPILLMYELGTVIAALGVTGGIFGAMSLYGMLTKRDLSGLGPVLFFGLIGLLIYSVIAMLFHMPMSDLLISLGGIALFIGFTAFDTQKIKAYYQGLQGDEVMLKKGAIVSALQLYLDFINLFLYVLRLFASKNN